MDFDSPTAAQKAVTALKASGVQAQMAKVSLELQAHMAEPSSLQQRKMGIFLTKTITVKTSSLTLFLVI